MDNVKLDQTSDVDKSSTFNIEAEQALIGLLLVNSEILGEIETIIDEDHFYDGLNRRIFSHIASRTKKGLIVSPITLKPYLDSDEAFKDIDVPSLLTELSVFFTFFEKGPLNMTLSFFNFSILFIKILSNQLTKQ